VKGISGVRLTPSAQGDYMKKYHIIIFLIVCSFVFANTIIDSKDNNGLLTRTITFSLGDKEFDSLSSIILTYNTSGNLLSRKLIFNEKYAKEKDVSSQEEILNLNGRIEKYTITFTSDYYQISGLEKQIETVDSNDNITEIEYYSNDVFLFKEQYQNRHTKFPFYKLSYLKKIMLEDFSDDPEKINYGLSMKYVSATSIVTFIDKPIDLNPDDKEFVTMYSKSRTAESLIPLYTKKVLVQEDDKQYYIMMQNQLLQFINTNKKAAISHYYGTRDNDFMSLCIGFTDID